MNRCLYLPILFCILFVITNCISFGSSDTEIVYLEVDDDFQLANDTNASGTTFIIRSGEHQKQSVENPKIGNIWIGEPGATMDGKDEVKNAFSGAANFITIEGINIRNYVDNGIYFRQGHKINLSGLYISDSGSGNGNQNGAIRLYEVRDVRVTDSRMTRVTAGILITRCRGPVFVHNNGGVNIGRNFVQLDKCKGENITISQNRMERRGTYLRGNAEDVVDWISIYQSSGTRTSPISVLGNRARGHGNDPTGSFIMLGDEGGRHQVAKENIGINPGQVGIGLSGGDHIAVKENLLFTDVWQHSNVAIYSANYTTSSGCSNHIIRGNRSYWYKYSAQQNNIWSDDICKPLIENNFYPDHNLANLDWVDLDF